MNPNLTELESEVLAEGREWTRQRLEQRLQAEADQHTACPQSGLLLKKRRGHRFTLETVSGPIAIRAPYGFSTQTGQWVCPIRRHWALEPHARLSLILSQRLARNAVATGSYEKAAEMAACCGAARSATTPFTPSSNATEHGPPSGSRRRLLLDTNRLFTWW